MSIHGRSFVFQRFLGLRHGQRAVTGAAAQTVTADPAQVEWRAQAVQQTRAVVATPARIQWRAQGLRVTRILGIFPSKMQWQVQALRLGGLVVITPARVRWQASAVVRQAVLGSRRGYMLGIQRGYPRRQAVMLM